MRVTVMVLAVMWGPMAGGCADSVEEVLQRLVARNEGRGGGVVRIADGSGRAQEFAAGAMAGPGSPAMEADTPFEVASVTKAVTAATALRLAEEGRLNLDARLGEVLPDGQAKGFDGGITVRQLLSHTSGLPNYWTDGRRDKEGNNAFLRAFLAEPGRHWKPEDMLGYAREMPARRPGAGFHYSDTNYVLLGLIIERAAGKPPHRVYREEVFEPLGMKDTWLTYHEPRRGAEPSHRYEDGEDMHEVERQSADWAGGGLMSTTRDLEKFLRGLASGALFRKPGTLEEMRKGVPVGEEGISYGLGLYRVQLGGGLGEVWGHDGHGNAFAYYWPERDVTFTGTLNQTENDWWPLVEAYVEEKAPGMMDGPSDKAFDAALSAGWDSLYMDRGANALGYGRYGSGIAWTDLDVTWGITEEDFLSLTAWQCFATQGPGYREFDVSLTYTRTIGELALNLQYAFNYGWSDGNFYSHEINSSASYELHLGGVTVIPAVNYFFTLGPDADDGNGFVQAGSSFLQLRVDGRVPVWHDMVALEPWGAFGVNFNYNTRDAADGETAPFVGANNLECGLAVPVRLNRVVTISGFGAYSYALTPISATRPSTFWGGMSVMFSY